MGALLLAIAGVILLAVYVAAHLTGAATSGTVMYAVVGALALLAALRKVMR